MVERSRDWIRQAQRDLENAKYEIEGGFYEWACFLSQQAAEKALKAVYQRLGCEAFGHSVLRLDSNLPRAYKADERFREMAMELDKSYIPTRHPNAIPEGAPFEFYTRGEAERLISYAEEIVRFCKDILSEYE
ncbi:MAG: HEPN domain-containing protein [Candidatus Bathyarchaeia archaeon]